MPKECPLPKRTTARHGHLPRGPEKAPSTTHPTSLWLSSRTVRLAFLRLVKDAPEPPCIVCFLPCHEPRTRAHRLKGNTGNPKESAPAFWNPL
jgi:hypothetical protein